MTKKELIDMTHKNMCVGGEHSRKTAEQAVNGVLEAIREELKNGGKVAITNFGTFEVSARAERVGHNPRTGEELLIEACNVVKFKPGKGLKDAVNI
jgi:DNA-binding protein HU-beta